MKEQRRGGELFYGSFIIVYSTLTVENGYTHTRGSTSDVLSPSETG